MYYKFDQNVTMGTIITKIIIMHKIVIILFKNNEVFCWQFQGVFHLYSKEQLIK